MDLAFQFPSGFEFFGVLIALCAVAIIALIAGAVWMYRDAESRRMDATVWLVILILATVFGNLLGFIIVIVVYLIVRESHPVGGAMPYGYGPPPGMPPVPAPCPVCGNPMTWYPQYARWYCPHCGQYR